MRFGHYELIRPIGQGGMAEVFFARDTRQGRNVAIKRVRPALQASRKFVDDFMQEARVCMSLAHPLIVSVLDVGMMGEVPYMALEWIDGVDAGALTGRMPVAEVLRVLTDVGEALAHAHARGVVHRDVSPANILVASSGVAKLADFGIAKAAGGATDATTTGVVKGKYSYLSPEQIRQQPATPLIDVFALCVTAEVLLTGRHPFRRATELETMDAILNAPRAPIAGLPAGLAELITAGLAADPGARLGSASAWVAGLDSVCAAARMPRLHANVARIVGDARHEEQRAVPHPIADEATRP